MENRITELLENRHTAKLEWREPWNATGPEGNTVTAHITLRATVHDCINLARHAAKARHAPTMGNDAEFLRDFIAVHWAAVYYDSNTKTPPRRKGDCEMKEGYWYCTECRVEVEPMHVTVWETHDERFGGCGCRLNNSKPDVLDVAIAQRIGGAHGELVEALREEMARLRQVDALSQKEASMAREEFTKQRVKQPKCDQSLTPENSISGILPALRAERTMS